MLDRRTTELAGKIIREKYRPSREEIAYLLSLEGPAFLDFLVCAGKIRDAFKKGDSFSCAIVNAKSGLCSEDCAYCAQSGYHETGVSVYPMMPREKMVAAALRMEAEGATHFSMVTSGLAPGDADLDTICRTAEEIRKKTALNVCASLGMLTDALGVKLRGAGVQNYHHNLETAESHFDSICTTHKYSDDLGTVAIAKKAGFTVCSGGIIGLGESWEQRVELAETLRSLDVDTIPINFLNPIPGTRLADAGLVSPFDALKTIALFRFINPDRNITICGGREVTLKDFQSWIFPAGANALMSGDYLTTKGRNIKTDMEMMRSFAEAGFSSFQGGG